MNKYFVTLFTVAVLFTVLIIVTNVYNSNKVAKVKHLVKENMEDMVIPTDEDCNFHRPMFHGCRDCTFKNKTCGHCSLKQRYSDVLTENDPLPLPDIDSGLNKDSDHVFRRYDDLEPNKTLVFRTISPDFPLPQEYPVPEKQ